MPCHMVKAFSILTPSFWRWSTFIGCDHKLNCVWIRILMCNNGFLVLYCMLSLSFSFNAPTLLSIVAKLITYKTLNLPSVFLFSISLIWRTNLSPLRRFCFIFKLGLSLIGIPISLRKFPLYLFSFPFYRTTFHLCLQSLICHFDLVPLNQLQFLCF